MKRLYARHRCLPRPPYHHCPIDLGLRLVLVCTAVILHPLGMVQNRGRTAETRFSQEGSIEAD